MWQPACQFAHPCDSSDCSWCCSCLPLHIPATAACWPIVRPLMAPVIPWQIVPAALLHLLLLLLPLLLLILILHFFTNDMDRSTSLNICTRTTSGTSKISQSSLCFSCCNYVQRLISAVLGNSKVSGKTSQESKWLVISLITRPLLANYPHALLLVMWRLNFKCLLNFIQI